MKFVKTITGKKLVNLSFVKYIRVEKDQCRETESGPMRDVWDVVLVVEEDNVFVFSRRDSEEEAITSLGSLWVLLQ